MLESPKEYYEGNEWQRDRYRYMSEFNVRSRISEFGLAKRGKQRYFHLITEKDSLHNFLYEKEILKEVIARHSNHKLGDIKRLLTNTVASQPCCFNLFVPLKNRPGLASNLFSQLLRKDVRVTNIEVEFTPGEDESLGDQSKFGGTDADVAVFYTDASNTEGVILIEFKYIESEFSVCSSYKEKNGKEKDGILKKNIRPVCNSPQFFAKQVSPFLSREKVSITPDCGYLKYNNWQLTGQSIAFDLEAVRTANRCPFRFSLQQLWRNLLLAENVARVRNLVEFHFWVLYPSQNKWLWKQEGETDVESEFRKLLTAKGNAIFARKDIKNDFIRNLSLISKDEWVRNWIEKFEQRYLPMFQ